jgi:hypothetical protein
MALQFLDTFLRTINLLAALLDTEVGSPQCTDITLQGGKGKEKGQRWPRRARIAARKNVEKERIQIFKARQIKVNGNKRSVVQKEGDNWSSF